MESAANRPLVVTSDDRLRDAVCSAAAAAQVEPELIEDPARLAALRRVPGLVVVGGDRASALARSPALRGGRVQLVGWQEEAAALCGWSANLGAPVSILPDGLRALTALFGENPRHHASRLVSVVGASGGVGTSTLAAALALRATSGGHRAVLVDLDPLAGGLDLLLGVEDRPGWRWPVLSRATGHLDAVHPHLPVVDGLAVLAHSRGDESAPGPEAVTSVLGALGRDHELVVCDVGRAGDQAAMEAARRSDRVLLVCSAQVGALAAARKVLTRVDRGLPISVVLRGGGGGLLEETRELLDIPVLAQIPDDRALVRAASAGEVPGMGTGRGWRRAMDALLASLEVGS